MNEEFVNKEREEVNNDGPAHKDPITSWSQAFIDSFIEYHDHLDHDQLDDPPQVYILDDNDNDNDHSTLEQML